MSIEITCDCGKVLHVKDELVGKRGRCPGCGNILVIARPVPSPKDIDDDLREQPWHAPVQTYSQPREIRSTALTQPVSAAARSMPAATAPKAAGERSRFFYLLLALALIPLAISTLHSAPDPSDDIKARMRNTLVGHPEVIEKLQALPKGATLAEALPLFPDHRIDGALLAVDSWAHWFFALLSAGAFFGLILLMFPGSFDNPLKLAGVGAFTATVGILLLLIFQYVAEATQGYWRVGFSWVTLLFYIVKFIGFSYSAAADPDNGFVLSFIGFTLGVGLCEEFCKAMPVLFHYRNKATMSWRAACMCGLASGAGFGVAEAIMYSSRHYYGLQGAGIYWVRFISCVALHALWTGGAAITIHRRQGLLNNAGNWWQWLLTAAALLAVPMVLHGLYDTLLKKEFPGWALLIAVATFAWFCFQIETARRSDEPDEPYPGRRALA